MIKLFYLLIFLLLSFDSMAANKQLQKNVRKPDQQENPFAVLPLDSTSESVLRSSEMKEYVAEDQQGDKKFRLHVESAIQKFPKNFPPEIDRSFFVYDCLFLSDQGFLVKYPKMSRSLIHHVCGAVQKEFRSGARP